MPVWPPLVSIVTPTFNRGMYLAETIESVLSQGYPSLEYIVLDDGSTDNTAAVIEDYRDRITYSFHPNMGEARTVNKGWGMAHGDFVGVVNSDDPILPGLVDHAAARFAADGQIAVVYPDWRMIDGASNTIKDVRVMDYDYPRMVRLQKCIVGPGAFIRRSALALESGRDPSYRFVGDFEFWLRLGRHGPMARIPETLATHRVHSGSASGKGDADRAYETMRVVDEYFKRGGLPSEIRQLEREARSNAAYHAARMCMASSLVQSRSYYRDSLRGGPGAYVHWRPQRLAMVVAAFLPEPLAAATRRLMESLSNSPMRYYGRD